MTATRLHRGLGVAVALLFTAGPVASQQVRAPIDPATVPVLKAELDSAAKLGFSVTPLYAVARNGALRAASTKAIRDAMRGLIDRLVTARDALNPVQGDAELLAGADAIRSGVPDGVLRDLRAVQRTRSLAVPLGVLQELVARGVPVKKASATVAQFLRANATDAAITAVASDMPALIAQGLAPSVALELRSRGVLSLPQGLGQPSSVAPTTIRPPPR
jgi:hypothetical protein